MSAGRVPLLDPVTGRFPDDYAPQAILDAVATAGEAGSAAALATVGQSTARVFNVTSEGQITGALSAIVALGGGVLRVPHGVTLPLSQTLVLPEEVSELVLDGWLTSNGGDFTLVQRYGVHAGTGQWSYTTEDVAAKSRTLKVANPSIYSLEDWIFVASTDVIPRSTDKRGYMRKITSISGDVLTVDMPFPRSLTMAGTARAYRVNMTRGFRLRGDGGAFYPDQSNKSSMFSFRWVHGLTIERGLRLHTGGGPCIALQHVVDFDIRATIERFKNDVDNGFVGYGVSCGGASRDGFVGGTIRRCRHAFTTVTGPIGAGMPISYAGEPENIHVAPRTVRCGDKALDTHVPGWGIHLHLRDSGSGGGIHIRSDATTADGSADGLLAPLVQYDAGPYEVPAVFGFLTATGTRLADNSWAVLSVAADAVFTALPEVSDWGTVGTLWKLSAGVRVTTPSSTQFAITTADVGVNNSTDLVDVTELSIPVKKGYTYLLHGYLLTTANQATDLALAWSAPADTAMDWVSNGPAVSATSTSAQITRNNVSAPGTVTYIGGLADATPMVALPEGRLVAGADGFLTLRFAQAAVNATNAYIRTGSWLRLDRVR